MPGTQVEATKFKLSPTFLDKYKNTKPPFGFNGLGELVYYRTYSRLKSDGSNEVWWETVARVVEGCYNMQRKWIQQNNLYWNPWKAQKSAQEMYDRIFNMKFLPPGRGLWAMGSVLTEERGIAASLFNCGFHSTEDLAEDPARPFAWLADASMLGIGVGFDTLGAGTVLIHAPVGDPEVFVIPDSREGWVESIRRVALSYLSPGKAPVELDYSEVRPEGEPIKGFGGVASGHEPLKKLHGQIRDQFAGREGEYITSRDIVDLMNYIGACIVAGNVRRCLPEGTLVHTEMGLIPIELVTPGTRVKTATGYAESSELLVQGEQSVMALNTQLGEFRCTPQHQLAVLSDLGVYTWKRASEVRPGDRLVFVNGVLPGRETSLPAWSYERPRHSTTCQDITIPALDEKLGWFVGFFQGNGYTRANHKERGFNAYISVITALEYPQIIEQAAAQIRRFGLRADVKKRVGENSFICSVASKQLAWYLDREVKQPNMPMRVPSWILEAPESVRAGFVAGLFDADGSRKNRPTCIVGSVYPTYLRDVQAVLASLGIPCRLRLHRQAEGTWKALYSLDLVGEQAVRDFERVVVPQSLKYGQVSPGRLRSQYDYGYPAEWLKDSDISWGRSWNSDSKQMTVATFERVGGDTGGLIPVEVLSTQLDVSIVNTYDISVPGAHEFVVQEGLLVHNSAELSLGSPDDVEYLNLKNYEVNPERSAFGWVSNNSVAATLGMDYSRTSELTRTNGEPGFIWLENIRAFGRMGDPDVPDDSDVMGCNPCGEIGLFSEELCNVVESFPNRHESLEDFKRTLKFAYLYAKTVTLSITPWPGTNAVMLKNRRIGISQSGVVQAMARLGLEEYRVWCDEGYKTLKHYDQVYSEWLAIPRSKRLSTQKPSGTVSLLAGATPGLHHPESRTYIRRMRLAKYSPLVEPLLAANYHIEPAVGQEDSTVVVEVPVRISEDVRTVAEVSMWEQLALAAFMQKWWCDNMTSATITFDPKTEGPQIARALDVYQYQLKGISFLPRLDTGGAYAQMPYEAISEEEYERRAAQLKPLNFQQITNEEADVERFCDGDKCVLF